NGVTAPNPHAPRATANRPAPLKRVHSPRAGALELGWRIQWERVLLGVLKPWLAHQSRFAVAATPLADSTPSDHDGPNAPATGRSVYVITHSATRQMRHPRWFGGAWPDSDG
ncbi:hypothetical protein OAO50_07140, partial [Paracoccaceae bacterium]|nr:hypothetical protein [Paracoccaceae bacterium]